MGTFYNLKVWNTWTELQQGSAKGRSTEMDCIL